MAADIEFDIRGLDDMLKNFEYVSDAVRGRRGRAALRKAAAVIVLAAKANAAGLDDPGTGRTIAENITARWNGKRAKGTGDLAFRIGVLKGAVLPKDNHVNTGVGTATPHWRLLEFGTKSSPAKPFLRPALDNLTVIAEVTRTFVDELDKSLKRAIKTGKTL